MFIAKLLFILSLIIIGWTDYKTKKIPDIWIGILLCLVITLCSSDSGRSISEYLQGMFCVSLPLFILALVVPGSFGGGDIKLMAVCGILLGWKGILQAFIMAVYIAGICIGVLLMKKRLALHEKIAFGPALCLGVGIVFLLNAE